MKAKRGTTLQRRGILRLSVKGVPKHAFSHNYNILNHKSEFMNIHKLVVIIYAVVLAVPIVTAKKKKPVELLLEKVEHLDNQVSHLSHKVDSLENVLLVQRLDASEKMNDLLRSYNELKESQEELGKRIDKTAPTIQIVGRLYSGLALARDGAKYGYVDSDGQMIIAAQFEEAYDFAFGYAVVKLNDKYGVIDTTGQLVIPCIYREIDTYNPDNNVYNLFIAKADNDLWGVIAPGKIVQDYIFTDINHIDDTNISECVKEGKSGILDEKGELITPIKYKYVIEKGNGTIKLKDFDGYSILIDRNGKKLK